MWGKSVNLYLFQYLLVFTKVYSLEDHVTNQNLQNYLNHQMEHTTNELTNLLKQNSSIDNMQTDIKFYMTDTTILPHNDTSANIFSLFNNTYVFIGSQLYLLFHNITGFALKEYMEFPNIQQKIVFTKEIQYENFGLILIAFPSGYSHIYGFLNSTSQWFFLQSISNENVASDAKFFINNNNIFLVLLNTMEHSMTTSVIYKWTGAHFDAVDQILTRNASTVLSFQYQEVEIIAIMQNFSNKQKPNFALYEFNSNLMRKMQLMLLRTPNHIISYTQENKEYLLIFEKANSTLYGWNGLELVSLRKFNSYKDIHKVLAVNINNISIIFIIQLDHLLAFAHSQNSLNLISEIKLNETFNKIIDMKLISYHEEQVLAIFILTTNNKLGYIMLRFNIFFNEADDNSQKTEVLLQCLSHLKDNIDANHNQLDSLTNPSAKIIQIDEPLEFSGRIDADSARAEAVNVDSQFALTESHHNAALLQNDLNHLASKLNKLNPQLHDLYVEGSVIHGKLVIAGQLLAEELQAKNLYLKFLNGVRWNPDVWLSYSKSQTITGPVLLKNLRVTNLNIDHQYNIFSDLVSQGINRSITNLHLLNGLKANNIFTTKINNIPFEDIYLRTKPAKILGLKKFDNLAVAQLQTNYLNEKNIHEALEPLAKLQSQIIELASDVKIQNFNYEEINGVQWKSFMDSVFRIGVTKEIKGNITGTMMASNNLYAQSISNIDTSRLFTTSTDQTVSATLRLRGVHAGNVNCNTVNGVDFIREAVRDDNNIVKGPVSIDNIHIHGDLNVLEPVDKVILDVRGDHVIGTKETDLLHIYNKKVKIIGNVIMKNIVIPDGAKVVVNKKDYNQNIKEFYWSKNQNQAIPVFFEAQHGISIPHLLSNVINDIEVNNYMINNLDDKLPTNLVFENVTVMGNIIINQTETHFPDLQKLNLESVKITGSYNITGHKTIQGKMRIGNLITNYLDDVKLSDVISSVNLDQIAGTKTFENLVIAENIIANGISTNVLNNVPLKTLVDQALYIDKPGKVLTMNIIDVIAHNIQTPIMNNVDINEYIKYLDNIYNTKVLNNVLVNGNVHINSGQQVAHINNYDVNMLPTNVVNQDGSVYLQNNVRFLGNVYAENVEVVFVNDIHFPDLIARLLYRNWDQNITVPYTFNKITAPNIYIPQINDIPTRNLVNIRDPNPQNLLAWGGLQLSSPKFLKSVSAELLTCNIQLAVANLKSPSTQYWNTIHVAQNITLWDDYSDLSVILRETVHSTGNNIINSKIVFQHHISANVAYVQKLVNGIDLNEILEDALLKDVEEQKVTGHKTFNRLAVSTAFVEGNSHIPIINKINIAQLNESIICKNDVHNSVIRGLKVFFGGVQANRLVSNTIADLNPHELVSLAALQKIPEVYFQTLEVDNNFDVAHVNDINILDRLSQRLLRNCPVEQIASGIYYFDNALLIGHSNITAINNLIVEDVVLDENFQVILNTKAFVQDIIVLGDATVEFLNGKNILDAYQQSILLGESNIINGNIKFSDVSVVNSNVQSDNLNGIAISYLLEHMESKTPLIQTEIVGNIIKETENVIKTSVEMSGDMPHKYLYLENSNELQISIPNALDAHVFEINGNVMLHVLREKEGSACGLPSTCSCQIQETIELTTGLSVNPIAEYGVQRVFSYEDQEMSIHFFTNSISSSEACRGNDTAVQNESASLMWMTYSPNKIGNRFVDQNHLSGYISGVEYFRSNGNTYMVVSRYYDPVSNSHNLDCLVYKFSKERMVIELVQIIKFDGAWTLRLLYTAQGITLVIGSVSDFVQLNHNSAAAEIHRFNETAEQFMLLRKVAGTGCISTVGVVLGSDSLLILAQKNTPLQVLKYHPKYDNYYFYQSIFLNSPVTGLSVFYIGDFGISDPLLCIVTENNNFYIYSFQYVQGWYIVSSGEIEGLRTLVPFALNHKQYLFALSTKHSTLVTVIKHGSN